MAGGKSERTDWAEVPLRVCPDCGGTGIIGDAPEEGVPQICSTCQGKGEIPDPFGLAEDLADPDPDQ